MNDDALLAVLGATTRAFAARLSGATGHEPVPTCPGWRVLDLVSHLGSVHRWAAATVLCGRLVPDVDSRPDGDDLPEWYAGTATALLTALAVVDADEPCENFSGVDPRAGFWRRRQQHETAIHLLDLECALGLEPAPVDPGLAADGVDEVLRVFGPRLAARGRPADLRAPVRLEALDVGRAWLLTPSPPGQAPQVEEPVASGTSEAVRGTATDVWHALWKRPYGSLEVTGPNAGAYLAGSTVP